MRLRIIPYSPVSEGARDLAKALSEKLGYKVWRGAPRKNKINLSWGGTNHGVTEYQTTEAIKRAVNKLTCFSILKDKVNIPKFTTDPAQAKWNKVCVRHILSGSEGEGLEVVDGSATLPQAPLYVEYVPKKKEFRVHVFNGKVIDVQEKRRRRNSSTNSQIRNTENGWVFCHQDIQEPDGLREQGMLAVKACGLLFGAVDIVWNQKQNKCYVLEINTSPGLCKTTVEIYSEAIKEWLSQVTTSTISVGK